MFSFILQIKENSWQVWQQYWDRTEMNSINCYYFVTDYGKRDSKIDIRVKIDWFVQILQDWRGNDIVVGQTSCWPVYIEHTSINNRQDIWP